MDPSKNIFWGLVVKPGKRYETEVQEPFRITKACLEPATAGGKVSSVFVECDNNEEFIIANLNAKTFNETIDLSFNEGEKICFKVDGPGTVHLTGNLLDDPPPDMLPGGEWSEEESGESEEEEEDTIEAGNKIQEVSEKEAVKILKRKKEQAGDVKPKKAKVEEMDTTADTSIGDLDDTDNFAEENDSESDDDEDSDAESDSDEENTTVGDVTTDMADTTAASDDDDDSSDEASDEEEAKPEPVKVETPVKKVEEAKVKTPKEKKKVAGETVETPKTKEKVKEIKTPKQEVKTPKAETKTPKPEAKTPKSEAKTSNQDPKESKEEAKTPKQESKTPKQESKTPKQEVKTPKQEAKTPKQNDKETKDDGKTPKQEAKTPKQDAKTPKDAQTPGKTPKDAQTPGKTPKRTLKGGVQSEDLKEGTGPECKPGNMVGMYYEGRLKSNNKKFDGLQSGKPFKFKLGSGQVIKGWDVGVLGMKVGGKRRLTIPPALGYGGQGAPPDIPPNATLVFDIECKLVK